MIINSDGIRITILFCEPEFQIPMVLSQDPPCKNQANGQEHFPSVCGTESECQMRTRSDAVHVTELWQSELGTTSAILDIALDTPIHLVALDPGGVADAGVAVSVGARGAVGLGNLKVRGFLLTPGGRQAGALDVVAGG